MIVDEPITTKLILDHDAEPHYKDIVIPILIENVGRMAESVQVTWISLPSCQDAVSGS